MKRRHFAFAAVALLAALDVGAGAAETPGTCPAPALEGDPVPLTTVIDEYEYDTQSAIVWGGTGYGLAWESGYDLRTDVVFARLDALGNWASGVVGFALVPSAIVESKNVAIATDGSNYGLVFDVIAETETDYAAYLAIVSSTGQPVKGEALSLFHGWSDDDTFPDIVWNGATFAVVWGGGGSAPGIWFNASESGGPAAVTVTESMWAERPSIAWNGSEYGVVWLDRTVGDDVPIVYFNRLDAGGNTLLEQPVPVSDVSEDRTPRGTPQVVWNGAGWAVAWGDSTGIVDYSARLRIFDAAGNPTTPALSLATTATSLWDVGIDWNGAQYALTWRSDFTSRIVALDAGGTVLADPIEITESLHPTLDWNGNGYGVSWTTSGGELRFQRVVCCADADGDAFTVCDGDCDDDDPFVHPAALESCNGEDDDCDGSIDETGSAVDWTAQTFTGYDELDDPAGWFDTGEANGLAEADTFEVRVLGDNATFASTGAKDRVHSHWVGPASDGWFDYVYSGRLRIDDPGAGVGLTAYSDYPNSDTYYYLRRTGAQPSFGIRTHGIEFPDCTPGDTGVDPGDGAWYRFEIEFETLTSETRIRARVWPDGAPRPVDWQTECVDATAERRTAGRVGLFVRYDGGKYFDDLRVVARGGRACGESDVGACAFGAEECVDGNVACLGEVNPGPERCDGLDNDCDGTTDEDYPEDADQDGRADLCDNCLGLSNPGQADFDGDGRGDDCDNCMFALNPSQSDVDGDSIGDHCDPDDGLIYLLTDDPLYVQWDAEAGHDSWNVYRGDLSVLVATGGYAQEPGSNAIAYRECGLSQTFVNDTLEPQPGYVAFYLTTGSNGAESGLGEDSAGQERANDNPCP